MGIFKKRVNEFPTPYTCTRAIREGGLETKLSMVLMGFGNIVHGQIIKGLLYLAVEVAYIVFMVMSGPVHTDPSFWRGNCSYYLPYGMCMARGSEERV